MSREPVEPLKLLPYPKRITYSAGTFAITPDKALYHNKFRLKPILMPIFDFAREQLKCSLPIDPIKDSIIDAQLAKKTFLLFWTTEDILQTVNAEFSSVPEIPAQGYVLHISPLAIKLQAQDIQGFFNGIQTLRQILEQVLLALVARGGSAKTFEIPCLTIEDSPSIPLRGFHIDLKVLMHRFDYLKEFYAILPQYKYNTFLVEYEDKFPYTGNLQVIRHKYCLSEQQLDDLLKIAARDEVEVIPLIQAFGHLPFVLQHAEFAKIREIPDNDWSLCPLNPDSERVVKEMIHQVCEKHPTAKYFHIGSDEVYQLGSCPTCNKYVAKHGKSMLYISWINKVAKIVKDEGKTPIMWSDYLIKYPEALPSLDKDMVVMYWDYSATGKETDYLWMDGSHKGNDILKRNSPERLKEIEKYIKTKKFPATVRSLPFIEYFHDRGFKVMGAPSANSDFYWTIPTYTRRLPNIACHANRIAESKALGVAITSWAECGTTFETQWHAILFGADMCWNPRPFSPKILKDFDLRFNATFFGCPTPIATNITSLLFDLIEKPEKVLTPDQIALQVNGLPKLYAGLQELRKTATKARETIEFLEFGIQGHELIFDITRQLQAIEDVFINCEENQEPMPGTDKQRAFRQELDALQQRVKQYYEDSHQKLENPEDGYLYPEEFLPIYNRNKHFPRLTEPLANLAAQFKAPRTSLDEILLTAYRRRVQ